MTFIQENLELTLFVFLFLGKKTHHPEMKIHIPLLELIDLKIKV